jgi:hypothetical protein
VRATSPKRARPDVHRVLGGQQRLAQAPTSAVPEGPKLRDRPASRLIDRSSAARFDEASGHATVGRAAESGSRDSRNTGHEQVPMSRARHRLPRRHAREPEGGEQFGAVPSNSALFRAAAPGVGQSQWVA